MTFAFSGRDIRVVMRKGDPWWYAADVCCVLDLKNPTQTVSYLNEDERMTFISKDVKRGNPRRVIISEAGLYSLILRSRRPHAQAFKRWITHEVIPTIRKTGSYTVSTDPKNIQETLRACADALDSKDEIIREQDEPLTPNQPESDSTSPVWCCPSI